MMTMAMSLMMKNATPTLCASFFFLGIAVHCPFSDLHLCFLLFLLFSDWIILEVSTN